ncbi:MAG: type II 3-dehydroquinate dehydratase [Proteobacteria bacterium]|nr:type II 3-dehydroquinate dehydratase [Pseudomonadota bacterium]MDA1058180.1 type II 3-dehydroquinate dehydratase [Pseudomonadota bacterium]
MPQTPLILVLNGPNLNLLGTRETDIYGTQSLADIEAAVTQCAVAAGLAVEFLQTNSESQLVDWVQSARDRAAGLIVNAGAYTHTSVALLDALRMVDMPIVEVHLSNTFRREEFRHHSYVSQAATGMIAGFGSHGYELAVDALTKLIAKA